MRLAPYRFIYVSESDAIGKTAKIACPHPLPAGNMGIGQSHVGLGPQRQGEKKPVMWVVYREAAPRQAKGRRGGVPIGVQEAKPRYMHWFFSAA